MTPLPSETLDLINQPFFPMHLGTARHRSEDEYKRWKAQDPNKAPGAQDLPQEPIG